MLIILSSTFSDSITQLVNLLMNRRPTSDLSSRKHCTRGEQHAKRSATWIACSFLLVLSRILMKRRVRMREINCEHWRPQLKVQKEDQNLECLFRRLIQSRVQVLNILSTQILNNQCCKGLVDQYKFFSNLRMLRDVYYEIPDQIQQHFSTASGVLTSLAFITISISSPPGILCFNQDIIFVIFLNNEEVYFYVISSQLYFA